MRTLLHTIGAGLFFLCPGILQAAVYDGNGINAGRDAIVGVGGISATANPRVAIANVINEALSYVALIAVVVVVIAGFYLILSLGDESGKEKAKKILIYTAAGIILLGLAKAIVSLFISFAS